MELGAFSISLTVKDLAKSKAFYEALGFESFADTSAHHYYIMKNSTHTIGIFQGMFDKNMLTFNPGWNHDATEMEKWDDIREIKQKLADAGIDTGADIENAEGPASFFLTDPDGNPVLIDQHR